MSDDKQKVLDFYLERETRKGCPVDLASDHNIRVINCCDKWGLNATLSVDEFQRLVIVDCPESGPLLVAGRLISSVAREARAQLRTGWTSRWNDAYIRKLIADLHEDSTALVIDPMILRTTITGEPIDGSYYVQDGNRRILASGVFFLETGVMPDLRFYIGTINEACFRARSSHGNHQHLT